MRKLKVGIIDILGKSATRKAWSRFIRASNTSIMPQVVAVWCEELGHDVSMVYYNGPEIMAGGIPDDVDIIFINAFSQNAMLAYALSNYFRSKGAVRKCSSIARKPARSSAKRSGPMASISERPTAEVSE